MLRNLFYIFYSKWNVDYKNGVKSLSEKLLFQYQAKNGV